MQVGAVFGLIMAIIVMGFVLVFGTGLFEDMMCIGNVGQTNKAVKSLESVIDSVQALDEGSSDTFRVSIPTNAVVCFVDPDDPRPSIVGGWMPDPELYPVIKENIETGSYNMWIEYNCGSGTNPGYVVDRMVRPQPGQAGNFCVRAGDTLLLTNVGVHVRVEKFTG